jgi:hypothetical protein
MVAVRNVAFELVVTPDRPDLAHRIAPKFVEIADSVPNFRAPVIVVPLG